MNIRPYNHLNDFSRVGDFLIETYQSGDKLYNWLQPRWEYMHFHPMIKQVDLSKIGIAEDGGEIMGVVHFEHAERQVYFQLRPGYEHIKPLLFDYAEENFKGISKSAGRLIRAIYINDFDTPLEEIVKSRGYQKWIDYGEDMSTYNLTKPVPAASLPQGFTLHSLADDLDLAKINRVLWRGFNHSGLAPEEEIQGRRESMQAPNFRKDLTIVVVAPGGEYVSYCGMWFVPQNEIAYIEPVATDPDYRRLGLGTAAVLESVRRVAKLGTEVVWVGSGLDFYLAMGFEKKFTTYPWVKYLD